MIMLILENSINESIDHHFYCPYILLRLPKEQWIPHNFGFSLMKRVNGLIPAVPVPQPMQMQIEARF